MCVENDRGIAEFRHVEIYWYRPTCSVLRYYERSFRGELSARAGEQMKGGNRREQRRQAGD